jgi:hypothetical protein
MIEDNDRHFPLPLIIFTCIALHHTLLKWQQYEDVNPNASKRKLNADRPNRMNYFSYKNDCCKRTFCCAATACKLLIFLGFADTYIILLNTWNTLLESYQQRVDKNRLATVKWQIQLAEN